MNRSALLLSFSFILLVGLAGCSDTPELDSEILAQADIVNLRQPDANIMSSGQPTEEQFRILAESGVKHVINLRPAEEQQDFDEGALVRELNMGYHWVPVETAGGITRENAESLYQLLESLDGEPVIVHCASGNRVGALIALSSAEHEGLDMDAAMAKGEQWGLTSPRLTPVVRETLASLQVN